MDKNVVRCPICKMEFLFDVERFTITENIKRRGMCESCFVKSKDLIKVDNHYVSWGYRHYSDTEEPMEEAHHDDINASFPSVKWCDKYKKYKVSFMSPDIGGHDVCHLTWYFDSKEDILKEMGL